MEEKKDMEMFVVYDRPKDQPDKVVIRRWIVTSVGARPDNDRVATVNTLEDAHAVLGAMGLISIGRQPEDDDAIAEVWL